MAMLTNKQLYKQNTVHDLNDAYYHVFLHASNHKYTNILVLEDDFFFDNITQDDVHDIGIFINNNDYHIYNLGPVFFIGIHSNFRHILNFYSSTAHSIIYNKSYFEYYIEYYNKQNSDLPCDILYNNINIIKYSYYKPLCFQLFPLTENSHSWCFSKLCRFLINLINLDKSHFMYYPLTILWLSITYMIMICAIRQCSL